MDYGLIGKMSLKLHLKVRTMTIQLHITKGSGNVIAIFFKLAVAAAIPWHWR